MSNIIGSPRPVDTGEYLLAEARVMAEYSSPVGREIALRIPFVVGIEVAHNQKFEADKYAAKIKVQTALRDLRVGLYLTDDMAEAMQVGESVSNEIWDEIWAGQCERMAQSILHYMFVGGSDLPPLFVKSIWVRFGSQRYYQNQA